MNSKPSVLHAFDPGFSRVKDPRLRYHEGKPSGAGARFMKYSKLFSTFLLMLILALAAAACGEESKSSDSKSSSKSKSSKAKDKGVDRDDYIKALNDINISYKKKADAADPFQGEDLPELDAIAAYAKVYSDMADAIDALEVPEGAQEGNDLYADAIRSLGEQYAAVGEAMSGAGEDPVAIATAMQDATSNIDTSKLDQAGEAFRKAGFEDAADVMA